MKIAECPACFSRAANTLDVEKLCDVCLAQERDRRRQMAHTNKLDLYTFFLAGLVSHAEDEFARRGLS